MIYTHSSNGHAKRDVRLRVLIQDYDHNLLEEASATLVDLSSQAKYVLDYDARTKRYSAQNLAPGVYRLETSCKPFESDSCEVVLETGERLVSVTLGPGDMPYYRAGGERAYYHSDEKSRLLLYTHGPDVAEYTPQILDGVSLDRNDDGGTRDEATYFVKVPRSSAKRERMISELHERIRSEFPKHGLSGRLAVPIRFRFGQGETLLGLTDEIVIRFKSDVTQEEARKLAAEFNCSTLRTVAYAGNAYLWRYEGPLEEVLEIIAGLQELPNTVYAEPNVIQRIELDAYSPSDYLYPEQPHFGIINADDAWDLLDNISVTIRAGSPNVCVAVFDPHGVDPTHPDLTGNLTDGNPKMVANFNFSAMAAQTFASLGGNHGTQCSSSAVGRFDGGLGGTGVAGNCRLIGARLPFNASGLDMADAWIWAAGFNTGNTNPAFPALPSQPADVISNSWGLTGGALTSFVQDALDFLTVYGRGGRGCIVCFSVGNLGYMQFSNLRRYAAYERTIAVGASINANPTNPTNSSQADPNGNTTNLPAVVDTRTYYSPYGPELDIVSPSHTAYDGGIIDPVVAAVRVDTGDIPGTATSTTSLAVNATAGATSLDVASTSGFAAGEFAALRAPGNANFEVVQINSIAGSTLNVSAIQNAHPAGTIVATGQNDYERSFGGTSHSCPTVAGATALIFSRRPELTWIQVREILRNSADEIDFGQADPIGQWVDTDSDSVNDFSQWYGYGRLNIEAAIQMAADDYDFSNLPDVVIRDNLGDNGDVPSAGWHAHSPDIWVRQSNDPIPVLAYNAAPPHENPRRGQNNYLYLRVRNRGTAATNEVYLRALIVHFPGFEFRYPQEWIPSTRPGDPIPSPLVPGSYLIGETKIDNLAPGDDMIVKMTWEAALIPPETVEISGIPVSWHPCILADVTPHDGPFPAGNTGYPVRHDNNLAHRNISVDDCFGGICLSGLVLGTYDFSGVIALFLERYRLPEGVRIAARIDDETIMDSWIKMVRAGKIREVDPIPGFEGSNDSEPKDKDSCLSVRVCEETIVEVACKDREGLLLRLPEGAEIMPLTSKNSKGNSKPNVFIDEIEGQPFVIFEGGASAIELPTPLRRNQFVPLILGIDWQGQDPGGEIRATQRLTDGTLSPGYTITG